MKRFSDKYPTIYAVLYYTGIVVLTFFFVIAFFELMWTLHDLGFKM